MRTMTLLMSMLLACVAVQADDTVTLDPRFRGPHDVYAMSFRTLPTHVEAWITQATTDRDDGRRTLATSVIDSTGFGEIIPITDPAINASTSMYDGVPTFDPCDPDRALIVSDRAVPGLARRSNDLYLVTRSSGTWTAERLPFNSPYWDDTPAFGGSGGSVVYFSSDRRRPGSGKADLYVVRRMGSSWSEPQLLTSICSDDVHETSPFMHGTTLYYSSAAAGDQDLYQVEVDLQTGLPTGAARRVDIPGVNTVGSNEYHPVVTPGGEWFVFSSDRDADGKHHVRLYYRRMPRTRSVELTLRVTARTLVRDAQKVRFFGRLDSIYAVRTDVIVRDIDRGTEQRISTDASGNVTIPVADASVTRPGLDRAWRRLVVRAVSPSSGLVSAVDTLEIGIMQCDRAMEHVIYLNDTASIGKKCEFAFRTFNVPFFVTAYWCPTTRKYRAYTPCASLFVDDVACEELMQPEHCETNEAYRYDFTPAKLVRTRRGGENCVNYGEFSDSGAVWADLVDRNIEHMRDEVRSALSDPCVVSAVNDGLPVEITYIGTTDDRSIHPKCQYTGKEYAEIRKAAPHIQVDTAIIPFMATGRRFNRGGYGGRAGGNQLLSDLRSLYFAILFDNLCTETIPLYSTLKRSGKLIVRSRGQAIDQRDLPFALKRAAGVEIRIPNYEQRFAGQPTAANRRVVFCTNGAPCR